MNTLRFLTIVCIFLTNALGSVTEVEHVYIQVHQKKAIGFKSVYSKTCEYFHNGTEVEQKEKDSKNKDISMRMCELTFNNMNYKYAGNWKISYKNNSMEFLITVVNKKTKVRVRPDSIESTANQSTIFYMPKINEKTKYCLLLYENKVIYNVTENKTDFLEPRYDCGVKMKIDLSRAGSWKFVQMVEGDKIYDGEFSIKVFENKNQMKVKDIHLILGEKLLLQLHEDVSNCVLVDPQGNQRDLTKHFCSYIINAVSYKDFGKWTFYYHMQDHYITYVQEHNVVIYEPYIETSVIYSDDSKIHLLCYVKYHTAVGNCYFEHPNGTLFILNDMIGGEKYESFTNISDPSSREASRKYCGITIRSPDKFDFGTWRCQIKVSRSPNLIGSVIHIQTPEEKKYQVTKTSSNVYVKRKKSFELSCTVMDIIQNCWIISPTGAVYTVNDKKYLNLEYKGRGFAMGDCGAIIKNATLEYQGDWKCEMKLENDKRVESRISVTVTETPVIVKQNKIIYTGTPITMSCFVIPDETFDFDVCRWIKPDGNGIYYEFDQRYRIERSHRECNLVVTDDNVEGQWTCVVQSHIGQQEIYSNTIHVYRECTNNLLTIIGSISLCLVFLVSCIILYLCIRVKKKRDSNIIELQ